MHEFPRFVHAKDYTASAAADLVAEYREAQGASRPAAALRALGTGTLVYVSALGKTISISVTSGVLEFVEAAKLDASNGVAVRAYW